MADNPKTATPGVKHDIKAAENGWKHIAGENPVIVEIYLPKLSWSCAEPVNPPAESLFVSMGIDSKRPMDESKANALEYVFGEAAKILGYNSTRSKTSATNPEKAKARGRSVFIQLKKQR